MGNAATLQQVMNEVSRHIEMAARVPVSTSGMNEFEAFVILDPLLADLNKQYLDARHIRANAEKEYGRDDAMSEMALDMEDSAWCAVQTRYMEVRAERAVMADAQRLMEEARIEELAATKARKESDALQRYQEMEIFARMHDQKGKFTGADVWLYIILLLGGERNFFRFQHPTFNFNRMAA